MKNGYKLCMMYCYKHGDGVKFLGLYLANLTVCRPTSVTSFSQKENVCLQLQK
jgi:hypothetical protein